MSMRESTRRAESITPTRIYPDRVEAGSRYMRFYLVPEIMARLRQHQRDADLIYYTGNPTITNRLGNIPLRINDYVAWTEDMWPRPIEAGVR